MNEEQSIVFVQPMGDVEARATLIQIRGNLRGAANLIADFDTRLGWRALGYPSLDACVHAEFGHENLRALIEAELGYSQSQAYRLAAANEVAANVRAHSPIGETVMVRERWVRATGITALPPEQQAKAIETARELAQAEGGHITARHVSEGVQHVQADTRLFTSRYFIVTHLVITGKISREAGLEMNAALETVKPAVRGALVELISKYTLTCPALLAPIGDLLTRRGTAHESKVLPEILSGYLGGVKLSEATLTDMDNARLEAAKEHQAEAVEAAREKALEEGRTLIEPVTLIVWPGDKTKSLRALKRDLGEARFGWLLETMIGE